VQKINNMLLQAGWYVYNLKDANIAVGGVVVGPKEGFIKLDFFE